MSQTGSRQRRRIATYRKGQRDLAADILPFFAEIENQSRISSEFLLKAVAIRNKLQSLVKGTDQ